VWSHVVVTYREATAAPSVGRRAGSRPPAQDASFERAAGALDGVALGQLNSFGALN
jgi:hypothetical protein